MKSTQEKNHILSVIKKPRITEKAGIKSESQNVYTFEVLRGSGKKDIAEAIKQIYKVTPIKINIVNLPAKNVSRGGKKGVKQAVKKALVFLKKGDKIAFI
jgi:large subunit ribosomal protein L23